MALAEPALRQFGFRKLQNVRFRGGSLLGSLLGTAIGIGYNLTKDYEISVPWNRSFQPSRRNPPGVYLNGAISSNEQQSGNKQQQAFRSSNAVKYRHRRYTSKQRRSKCCCSCNC